MLNAIRNFNVGYVLLLIGIVLIISGFDIKSSESGEKTFLCFDKGCMVVQGYTNIFLGILTTVMGVMKLLRSRIKTKKRRPTK